MRIDEIISTKEKNIEIPQTWDLEAMKAKRSDAINAWPPNPEAGYYSQGYQTKDPFLYGKKAHVPTNLDYDPYYQYVKAIEPIMDSNPYVPRVYVVKLYRDQQGYIKPDYTMEKLVKGQTLPKKLIYGMGVRMFGSENWFDIHDKMMAGFVDPVMMSTSMKYEDLDSTDLWKKLAKVIDMSIETYPANSFSNLSFKNFDPNLLQLIALIKRLIIRVPHTESDVHANNIMVRMGTTPQVVLSDPISSEDTLNPTQYQTT
jgi:hypothetical protein